MLLEVVRLSEQFPKSNLLKFQRHCGSESSDVVIPKLVIYAHPCLLTSNDYI